MRILTAKEFLKEPYGTVYIHYTPQMFIDQPKIKSEERGGDSWWATNVLPWIEADSCTEASEILFEQEEQGGTYVIPTSGFCTDDAVYNHDDDMLYAVFNKEEVIAMINRLMESLII